MMRVARDGRTMRGGLVRGLVVLAALAGALSGCTQAPATNPNLLAPKLVIDYTVDGRTELYMHSAFGERAYDNLTVTLDNVTLARRTFGFSLDVTTERTAFFLSAYARAGASRFSWQGQVVLSPVNDTLAVVPWAEDGPLGERTGGLPYEILLENARSP